jgi:hypothetical protein
MLSRNLVNEEALAHWRAVAPKKETDIVGVKLKVMVAVKMKFCVFCCDVVYSGGYVPTFRRNFLPPRCQISE